jgi:hypothetical protein
MSETYRLFLNIQNPKNVVDANAYTYYINWQSFLPEKYKKYQVNFSHHRNQTQNGSVISNGVIRASSLRTTTSQEQNYSGSNILGSYIPNTFMTDNVGNVRTFFSTKHWDNVPKLLNYPIENYMSVTIESVAYVNNTFLAGSALLFLNFTPIKKKKINKKRISPRLKKKYKLLSLFN